MSKLFDGSALRAERKKRGIRACELANELNVSRAYLSQLEHGSRDNPDMDILEKLAEKGLIPAVEKKPTIYRMGCGAAAQAGEKGDRCRCPSDCDLPARLAAMDGQMTEVRLQLQMVLDLLVLEVRDRAAKMKKGAA